MVTTHPYSKHHLETLALNSRTARTIEPARFYRHRPHGPSRRTLDRLWDHQSQYQGSAHLDRSTELSDNVPMDYPEEPRTVRENIKPPT
jgi:hypothetical protein